MGGGGGRIIVTMMLCHLSRLCVGVTEPTEEVTITWPDDSEGRRFIIQTTKRDFFLIADTAENKK